MRRPPPDLRKFLEPYDARVVRLFLATRAAILAEAPEATELVYDAYNAVAAAYSFSQRLKEAFCHVAAYRDYVNLGFNRGAELTDNDGLLAGSGRLIRHVRVAALADLEGPGVRRLLREAVAQGATLVAAASKPRSIIKAVYPKKRRPAKEARRRRLA